MNINTEYLKSNLENQRSFICDGVGNILVFANYWKDRTPVNYPIEGQSGRLSEEFLRKNAFNLGVQSVKSAKAQAIDHEKMGDDYCPEVHIDWGVGMTAALTTGGDVIFEESTTYTTGPIVKNWDNIDDLEFPLSNKWIDCAFEFWRGVESDYADGISVTPNVFRSPLDLANDIRGDEIFVDLYYNPECVERLLDICTDSLIKLDKLFRSEFRILREAPSGVWGCALPSPGMMFVNGDPVDLIPPEDCYRFDKPYNERLINYAGSLYFHHHSIGVSRACSVSYIKGLSVQEILQDPNGPNLLDCIDDDMIDASLRVPIELGVNLCQAPNFDELLERLRQGRFIIHVNVETLDECRSLLEKIAGIVKD